MDLLLFVLRLAALGFVAWGGFLIHARPSRRRSGFGHERNFALVAGTCSAEHQQRGQGERAVAMAFSFPSKAPGTAPGTAARVNSSLSDALGA
ncbi:MAG TPA: hypothetical protein VE085_05830 [Burkholderiales bacterium]|nr:hypothetical protein [Burkholderiales bacterium]